MKKETNYKKFMSYNHKVIWYTVVNGDTYYAVSKGDGTDKMFSGFEEAMEYIDNMR